MPQGNAERRAFSVKQSRYLAKTGVFFRWTEGNGSDSLLGPSLLGCQKSLDPIGGCNEVPKREPFIVRSASVL